MEKVVKIDFTQNKEIIGKHGFVEFDCVLIYDDVEQNENSLCYICEVMCCVTNEDIEDQWCVLVNQTPRLSRYVYTKNGLYFWEDFFKLWEELPPEYYVTFLKSNEYEVREEYKIKG